MWPRLWKQARHSSESDSRAQLASWQFGQQISADLALTFFFLFFLRGLLQIASLTLTKESGKLKLNFIGRYEQTQAIIGMAALIQINNQHQREVKHRFDHAGDPSVELKESEMELWITELKRLFLFFFTPYSNSSSFLLLLLLLLVCWNMWSAVMLPCGQMIKAEEQQ